MGAHAEDLLKDCWIQSGQGRAIAHNRAALEHHQPISIARSLIQVVQDHGDGHATSG